MAVSHVTKYMVEDIQCVCVCVRKREKREERGEGYVGGGGERVESMQVKQWQHIGILLCS